MPTKPETPSFEKPKQLPALPELPHIPDSNNSHSSQQEIPKVISHFMHILLKCTYLPNILIAFLYASLWCSVITDDGQLNPNCVFSMLVLLMCSEMTDESNSSPELSAAKI